MSRAKQDEILRKIQHGPVVVRQLPIEPASLGVLAVGIIVALLRSADFNAAVDIGTPWESNSVVMMFRSIFENGMNQAPTKVVID